MAGAQGTLDVQVHMTASQEIVAAPLFVTSSAARARLEKSGSVDLIVLTTAAPGGADAYVEFIEASASVAREMGGRRLLGGRMDPGHRWAPHADRPAVRIDDYVIDSFPSGAGALRYVDKLREWPPTSKALCRTSVLACVGAPTIPKLVNCLCGCQLQTKLRDAPFDLKAWQAANAANVEKCVAEKSTTRFFDRDEFARAVAQPMNVPAYMLNLQVKRRSCMGPLNVDYDVKYSDAVPPLVFRSGGSMAYSSLGAWAVCAASDDDPVADTEFDEVTIFRYHTRATFLTTILGDEYQTKCAEHRDKGLTLAYLALTTAHGPR